MLKKNLIGITDFRSEICNFDRNYRIPIGIKMRYFSRLNAFSLCVSKDGISVDWNSFSATFRSSMLGFYWLYKNQIIEKGERGRNPRGFLDLKHRLISRFLQLRKIYIFSSRFLLQPKHIQLHPETRRLSFLFLVFVP